MSEIDFVHTHNFKIDHQIHKNQQNLKIQQARNWHYTYKLNVYYVQKDGDLKAFRKIEDLSRQFENEGLVTSERKAVHLVCYKWSAY
eukprot:2665198-Amphidinium_carterae.1